MSEKNEKQLESMESDGWWKRLVLSREWKRGVTDGDSGDEGNDELTCVRSEKSK